MTVTTRSGLFFVFALTAVLCVPRVLAQRACPDVEAALGPAWDTAATYDSLNIVLVWGEKDAGYAPGAHEWPTFAQNWEILLAKAPGVTVSRAYYQPSIAQWAAADVVVFYMRTHTFRQEDPSLPSPPAEGSYTWGNTEFMFMDNYLQAGGGMVIMHSATYPDPSYYDAWAARAGLAWEVPVTTFREGNLVVEKTAAPHPITAGIPDTLHFFDETYFPMTGPHADQVTVLATTNETYQGQANDYPALWTFNPPNTAGRVYGFIMGHLTETFDDPMFRGLLLRGIAWSGNTDFSRFRPVVYDGADVTGECSEPVSLRGEAGHPVAPYRLTPDGAGFEWRGETWRPDGRRSGSGSVDGK